MIAAGVINLENGDKKTGIWYFEYPYIIVKTVEDDEIVRIVDSDFRELLTAYCKSNPSNETKTK
jgi:hypothetical protein